MKNPVILNVAVNHWYPFGQTRLQQSLALSSIPIDTLFWHDEYPPGSPPHPVRTIDYRPTDPEVPYAFKAYATKFARELGYTKIFWMDASCYLRKDWGDFWEVFNDRPMTVWECDAGPMGMWCCDAALPLIGCTREGSWDVPLIVGGVHGWNFDHPKAEAAWDDYWEMATNGSFKGIWRIEDVHRLNVHLSDDPRVRGHRHDMPALSMAVKRAGCPILQWPNYFNIDGEDRVFQENTCIGAKGM